MKYILVILFTIFYSYQSLGQFRDFEISSSVGLGLVEGMAGFSVDGEIGLYLEPKINVGIYFNLMNAQRETNPIGPRASITLDPQYFNVPENYLENIHCSQNSIGIQGRYLVLNNPKFEIAVGGGINYNIYKMLDFSANALNDSFPYATYYKWHDHGVGYHGFADLSYKINQAIGFGLKSRMMHFKDFNFSFMLSTKIRLNSDKLN